MAQILVTDGMAAEGIALLKQAGHTVDSKKISVDELLRVIGQYDGLVVRSATQVNEAVIKAGAPRLKIVGRTGRGGSRWPDPRRGAASLHRKGGDRAARRRAIDP